MPLERLANWWEDRRRRTLDGITLETVLDDVADVFLPLLFFGVSGAALVANVSADYREQLSAIVAEPSAVGMLTALMLAAGLMLAFRFLVFGNEPPSGRLAVLLAPAYPLCRLGMQVGAAGSGLFAGLSIVVSALDSASAMWLRLLLASAIFVFAYISLWITAGALHEAFPSSQRICRLAGLTLLGALVSLVYGKLAPFLAQRPPACFCP